MKVKNLAIASADRKPISFLLIKKIFPLVEQKMLAQEREKVEGLEKRLREESMKVKNIEIASAERKLISSLLIKKIPF